MPHTSGLILYMLASSQWETSLQSNAVSDWVGANIESALHYTVGLADTIAIRGYATFTGSHYLRLWKYYTGVTSASWRLKSSTSNKENSKTRHNWPFVKRIHQWKTFPDHAVMVHTASNSSDESFAYFQRVWTEKWIFISPFVMIWMNNY